MDLDKLTRFMIATEVDDISIPAQAGAQSMSGKSSRGPGSATGVTGKEDIGDVDIIHSGSSKQDDNFDGTPDEDDTNVNDPPSDNPEDDEEDPNATDDADEDAEDVDGETTDDPTNMDDDSHNQDPAFDKNKIKDNLILFHGIISSNINLLRDCMRQITDPEMIKIYNNVIDNFQNCKTLAYELITKTNFAETAYTDLLRKYVALNRVHELGIKMIKLHSDEFGVKNLKSAKKKK